MGTCGEGNFGKYSKIEWIHIVISTVLTSLEQARRKEIRFAKSGCGQILKRHFEESFVRHIPALAPLHMRIYASEEVLLSLLRHRK